MNELNDYIEKDICYPRSPTSERPPSVLNSHKNTVGEAELGPKAVQQAIAVLEAAADSRGLQRLIGEIKNAYRFDRALLEIEDDPDNNEFCYAALTEADTDE